MLTVIIRTAVLYVVLVVAVRLLGKRQIGQMEPSEFVLALLIANLASIPIENPDVPLLYGVVPIALTYGAEMLMSVLTLRSIKLRRIFCGKPVLLIEEGKISQRNLRRTRINLDELTMHLREKGVFDLTAVKFAILETNGQVSTLLYAKDEPADAKSAGIRVTDTELPVTIVSDGKLLHENLKLARKDKLWVEAQLRQRNCTLGEVLVLTVDAAGKTYFVRKQENT